MSFSDILSVFSLVSTVKPELGGHPWGTDFQAIKVAPTLRCTLNRGTPFVEPWVWSNIGHQCLRTLTTCKLGERHTRFVADNSSYICFLLLFLLFKMKGLSSQAISRKVLRNIHFLWRCKIRLHTSFSQFGPITKLGVSHSPSFFAVTTRSSEFSISFYLFITKFYS